MRRPGERGLSILEVMFAVLILGGILAYLFRTADAVSRTARISDWKVTAAAESFKAVGALAKDLRLAVADPNGPHRYQIGAGRDWISYHLLDGESLSPAGRVVPVFSPRIFVFLAGEKLVRAVVDESLATSLPIPPEAVIEVKVLAERVAKVEFGDPREHSGSFLVRVTTLVGDPATDRHVESTNSVLVASLNRTDARPEAAPPAPSEPIVYVEGSRQGGSGVHLRFESANVRAEPLRVNGFRLDWSHDGPAYVRSLRLNGETFWKSGSDAEGGAGPNEVRYFTEQPWYDFLPGEEVAVWFKNFKKTRSGGGGAAHLPPETPFTLTLLLDDSVVATVPIPPSADDEEGDDDDD